MQAYADPYSRTAGRPCAAAVRRGGEVANDEAVQETVAKVQAIDAGSRPLAEAAASRGHRETEAAERRRPQLVCSNGGWRRIQSCSSSSSPSSCYQVRPHLPPPSELVLPDLVFFLWVIRDLVFLSNTTSHCIIWTCELKC